MATLCFFLNLYALVILARVAFSWFRVTPDTALASVYSVIYNLTEPILGPLRRVLPPMRMGAAALDLSPIAVFVLIYIVCR